ncbi:MAG TPA: ABC transporter ATP-binding protein [Virgibacillus sp.]|nr:ABC transporter ATP-binding protein [Virgibacillus sp.]
MIRVHEVTKSYIVSQDSVSALSNVSLTIRKGEWITILGPSGSGKSTLLNCIGGMELPSHGNVEIDGQSTSNMTNEQLQALRRHQIGYIFQDFRILPQYNVLDNVCLPLLPYEKRATVLTRAKQRIEDVDLIHRLNHLPEELSGGEKQRVAIARALMNDPDILICDEPTGNLDEKNRDRILQTIAQLHNKGHTIVIATHDPDVAKEGERSIYLRDGQVEQEVII